MRTLHIISNLRPEGGGPQEAVRLLIRYAPEGSVNEVVTLDDPAAAFLREEPFPIHALGRVGKSSYSPKLVPWLRANRDRFDAVVLHGMWEYLSFAVLRAIAGHKPYAVYPHGMLDPYFKRGGLSAWIKHMKKWLYWAPVQYWVLRRATRVVFTTRNERELAAQSFRLHRWKAEVIALGAMRPPADLMACKEAFFARHPGLRGKRFLLFLGRIDPKKGCDLLLQAFATVARSHPDLHLVMAGPDRDHWQPALEAASCDPLVEGRVWWTGMVLGDVKWGAFAAAEAFLLPSHQENFGIAIVEALACARPVLIAKPINIAADLEADGCALVAADTLEGTRELLTRWVALSPEERDTMSQRARATVAKRYDMRRNALALRNVFTPAMESASVMPAGFESNVSKANASKARVAEFRVSEANVAEFRAAESRAAESRAAEPKREARHL